MRWGGGCFAAVMGDRRSCKYYVANENDGYMKSLKASQFAFPSDIGLYDVDSEENAQNSSENNDSRTMLI